MPRMLERSETLSDGTEVVLRPIRPDDGERLRRLNSRLSPETRYLRFFTDISDLPESVVDYLVNVDYIDRYALVALIEDEIAGVARYDRLAPDRAEAAVVVEDGMQGRGLGTLLMTKLAAAARRRGIVTFEGDVLAENRRMLELVRSAGGTVSRPLTEEAILADLEWPVSRGPEAEVVKVEYPLARGGMRKFLQAIAVTQSVLLPPRGLRSRVARLAKAPRPHKKQ